MKKGETLKEEIMDILAPLRLGVKRGFSFIHLVDQILEVVEEKTADRVFVDGLQKKTMKKENKKEKYEKI